MYNPIEFKQQVNRVVKTNLLNPKLKGALIADAMGVNRMYIHRKLKAYYEMNARQFITEKRIAFAKKQLLQTNMSIRDIATMIHFCDVPHFSKTFKTQTGYTPSKYRKQAREL